MDPRPDGFEYDCICDAKIYHVGHKFSCQAYNLRRMREQSQPERETGIARHWRERAELENPPMHIVSE